MTKFLYGERYGKNGKLRIGCSATIFDEIREKVFLTRRQDNGMWCLPGGHMEAGESIEECCICEVFEDTGMKIRVKRLSWIYSDPDQLVIYPDGNQAHFVAINFEAIIIKGDPVLSDETSGFGYFSMKEIKSMPTHDRHADRIADTIIDQKDAYIR